jgi:hypothetical protein
MPQVRVITAWYTETIEIQWFRPLDPTDPVSNTVRLIERHTAPPDDTWKARREVDERESQR